MILQVSKVVPYIGTWIETPTKVGCLTETEVVPYIGTWIETKQFTEIGWKSFSSYLI